MLHLALRLMRVFLQDLTQKELAELLRISKSHISEIEAGKKTPTLAVLERYASVFEVPVSSIFLFSENMYGCMQGKPVNTDIPEKLLALLKLTRIMNCKG